jgi:hypothetical protein
MNDFLQKFTSKTMAMVLTFVMVLSVTVTGIMLGFHEARANTPEVTLYNTPTFLRSGLNPQALPLWTEAYQDFKERVYDPRRATQQELYDSFGFIRLFETVDVYGNSSTPEEDNHVANLTSRWWRPVYLRGGVLTLFMTGAYRNSSFTALNDTLRDDFGEVLRIFEDGNLSDYVVSPANVPGNWQISQSHSSEWTGHPAPASGRLFVPTTIELSARSSINRVSWRFTDAAESFANTQNGVVQSAPGAMENSWWTRSRGGQTHSDPFAWTPFAGTPNNPRPGFLSFSTSSQRGVRAAIHIDISKIVDTVYNIYTLSEIPLFGAAGPRAGAVNLLHRGANILSNRGFDLDTDIITLYDLYFAFGLVRMFETVDENGLTAEPESGAHIANFTSRLWRPVHLRGDVLTLLSMGTYRNSMFNPNEINSVTGSNPNVYEDSLIRSVLLEDFDTVRGIFDIDDFLVAAGDVPGNWHDGQANTNNWVNPSVPDGDSIFLPSLAELWSTGGVFGATNGAQYETVFATNYNTMPMNQSAPGTERSTWTRSRISTNGTQGPRWTMSGNTLVIGTDGVTRSMGIRPAIHINLSELLSIPISPLCEDCFDNPCKCPCPHFFPSTWTIITPATCISYGIESRTCTNTNCGHTETQAIPNNPCNENSCSLCNPPCLTHNWSSWTITTNPTCTAQGLKERHCEICDHPETNILAPDPRPPEDPCDVPTCPECKTLIQDGDLDPNPNLNPNPNPGIDLSIPIIVTGLVALTALTLQFIIFGIRRRNQRKAGVVKQT